MKKLLVIMLCLIMSVSLFSCESKDTSDEKQTQIPEASNDQNTVLKYPVSNNSSNTSKPVLSKKELAMQAYDAVLKNKTPLLYETGKELYFQDIFYFVQYDIPLQAFVDMDQDGIDEVVITQNNSSDSYKILLHYDNNIVYGFKFEYNSMGSIFSDGSFSWSYYVYSDSSEYGCSRLSFEGSKLKFQELYRTEGYYRFYIDGIEVTRDEYYEYLENNPSTSVQFEPLDISVFDSSKAIAIASKYWGITQGSFDEETGYRYRLNSYKDGNNYRVCLYWFVENSYYEHLECVSVNLTTGEISIPTYPDGK